MADSTRWPDDYRCAVVFSFDLDADTNWRRLARAKTEWDRPLVRTRGEFGPAVGTPRILDVFNRHDARCTFFVPGETIENWTEVVQTVRDEGHEVAHHGYDHVYPSTLSREEEREKIKKGLVAFEDHLGERPVGYRSPGGDPSDHTIDLLAENGFLYDSSMMNTDLPYIHEAMGEQIVEVPFDWSYDDWAYFGFNAHPPLESQSGIAPAKSVFDDWHRAIDGQRRHGGTVVLTIHPQLTGRSGRIDALEEVLEAVTKAEDIWVTTAEEIATHWLDQSESSSDPDE